MELHQDFFGAVIRPADRSTRAVMLLS